MITAGKSKIQSVKFLSCFTSLSLQLQKPVLSLYHKKEILDNLLLKNCLKKKNYFWDRVIKRFIRQLNGRLRSIWYKPGGSDIFWQNLINGRSRGDRLKKKFRLTKEKIYELVKWNRKCPSLRLNLACLKHSVQLMEPRS